MTTPVKNFGDYTICFEAQEEDRTARHHFIKECGWSESQFRKIKDFPFFCAVVTLWKNGEELNTQYLGACSYATEEEFYTAYVGDYFADMVSEAANEHGDESLITSVEAWRASLRLTA